MRPWFNDQTRGIRWAIAGTAVGAVALIAVLAVILTQGGSSISDGSPCQDLLRSDSSDQIAYLSSKLDDPSKQDIAAYLEGFRVNCSKGYPNSTTGREFEATESEIAEVESEGGSAAEGASLVRERAEEREVYGEFLEAAEGP